MRAHHIARLAALVCVSAAACPGTETTSRLPAAERQRLEAEGIRREAPDQVFRWTHDPGRRDAGWEERRATILVTDSTVLIHKNGKVGVEITPRTRRVHAVERSGGRVRIRAGSGRSEELWSFEPAEDAEGWTTDIRAVIRNTAGARREQDVTERRRPRTAR